MPTKSIIRTAAIKMMYLFINYYRWNSIIVIYVNDLWSTGSTAYEKHLLRRAPD
jgi:hypothetical protein